MKYNFVIRPQKNIFSFRGFFFCFDGNFNTKASIFTKTNLFSKFLSQTKDNSKIVRQKLCASSNMLTNHQGRRLLLGGLTKSFCWVRGLNFQNPTINAALPIISKTHTYNYIQKSLICKTQTEFTVVPNVTVIPIVYTKLSQTYQRISFAGSRNIMIRSHCICLYVAYFCNEDILCCRYDLFRFFLIN